MRFPLNAEDNITRYNEVFTMFINWFENRVFGTGNENSAPENPGLALSELRPGMDLSGWTITFNNGGNTKIQNRDSTTPNSPMVLIGNDGTPYFNIQVFMTDTANKSYVGVGVGSDFVTLLDGSSSTPAWSQDSLVLGQGAIIDYVTADGSVTPQEFDANTTADSYKLSSIRLTPPK
jgi:hypothetical protein